MHFSLFPAYFENPENIRFDQQETDEKIILFLRRHWFTNVLWIIGATLGFLGPIIALQLDLLFGTGFFSFVPTGIIMQGLIVWYLILTAFVLENFLYWYFNIYIVTNHHIVDLIFASLLNRDLREAQYNDIQNVSSRMMGVFGPLFNFGDVVIETASKGKEINFRKVPKPDVVADRITDIQQDIEGRG